MNDLEFDDVSGQTLNKARLADAIQRRYAIDRSQAKLYVETFFKLISAHLAAGDTVKIPGLGNFTVRDKVARPGRNLKTGATVMITERRVVTFHPSGTLNQRVTESLIARGEAAQEEA